MDYIYSFYHYSSSFVRHFCPYSTLHKDCLSILITSIEVLKTCGLRFMEKETFPLFKWHGSEYVLSSLLHIFYDRCKKRKENIEMYRHEHEPGKPVAPSAGQRGTRGEIAVKWVSSVNVPQDFILFSQYSFCDSLLLL